MRRALMKARWLWLLAPLAAASCSDEKPPPAPVTSLSSCVDPPAELLPPSEGRLPCELLPPGLTLPQQPE